MCSEAFCSVSDKGSGVRVQSLGLGSGLKVPEAEAEVEEDEEVVSGRTCSSSLKDEQNQNTT